MNVKEIDLEKVAEFHKRNYISFFFFNDYTIIRTSESSHNSVQETSHFKRTLKIDEQRWMVKVIGSEYWHHGTDHSEYHNKEFGEIKLPEKFIWVSTYSDDYRSSGVATLYQRGKEPEEILSEMNGQYYRQPTKEFIPNYLIEFLKCIM